MKNNLYIIDDNADYANMLVKQATKSGWQAHSIQEPAEFLNKPLPESGVIFLDLTMPDMDGFQVIEALAEKQCKLSLVLISGYDEEILSVAQNLASEHNLNVYTSLTKPVPMKDLLNLFKKLKEI